MDEVTFGVFQDLTGEQRTVLLRLVADGCQWLHCWGTSCTTFASWAEVASPGYLAEVCAALVGKGLVQPLNADLGLYRPTVAGVQLVQMWLREFLAYPPVGVCHE